MSPATVKAQLKPECTCSVLGVLVQHRLNTVEQQIFASRKFSRISRFSGNSQKFPARQYYQDKERLSYPLIRNNGIENRENFLSRKFPVLQYRLHRLCSVGGPPYLDPPLVYIHSMAMHEHSTSVWELTDQITRLPLPVCKLSNQDRSRQMQGAKSLALRENQNCKKLWRKPNL